MFFEKAGLEKFAEKLMDKGADEMEEPVGSGETSAPEAKERDNGEDSVTLDKDFRHEAFESGKREGQLLLMGEKEKVQMKNAELEKDREVLKVNKKFLEKALKEGERALKDKRVQKYFAWGFLFLWIVGWLVFYVWKVPPTLSELRRTEEFAGERGVEQVVNDPVSLIEVSTKSLPENENTIVDVDVTGDTELPKGAEKEEIRESVTPEIKDVEPPKTTTTTHQGAPKSVQEEVKKSRKREEL